MNPFSHLLDPASWAGNDGIANRLLEHLAYSGAALALAAVIALPLGILIGHTGRGSAVVGGLANATRAIPTLGLLVLVVTLMGTGMLPVVLALAVLAIPPILSATVAGFANADGDAVLAAHAMGMTDGQVVSKVELPLALPLIVSGFRSASLQVVATATVAAMAAAGGLGRLVIDGQKRQGGYPEMLSGALLVMVLAIAVDLLLGAAAWLLGRRTQTATTGAAR
ncbi:ABC transporter permease [Mariniluteicoccus flavus]